MTKPDASVSAAGESVEKADVQTVDEKPAEPALEQQQHQQQAEEHTSEASDGLVHKDTGATAPEQNSSVDGSNMDNSIQPAKDNDGGASTKSAGDSAEAANAAALDATVSGNISSESPGPAAHVVEADTVTPAALATAAAASATRAVDGETQHTEPPSLSSPHPPHLPMPGKMIRHTSTSSSSSKVHDAIQDIISQFDPLKVSASTAQLPEDSDAPTSSTNTQQTASTDPATTAVDAENRRRQQADLRSKFEPETDGFNYNDFLQQLRHPAAKPVARTVKNFLTEFSRRPMTLSEQVRFVHDFLAFVADKMRECTVWQSMGEREFDNAREGMEKLVMNRLYHLCFSPSTSDDSDKDHVISEKMSLFRWIRAEHLDIQQTASASATESFLQFARTELLKINSFKSPRDK
ncbi:hypothetical protein H4S06_001486, partial [Coemansia sp. BCRC 34490]